LTSLQGFPPTHTQRIVDESTSIHTIVRTYRKQEEEGIDTRLGAGKAVGNETKSLGGFIGFAKGGQGIIIKVGHDLFFFRMSRKIWGKKEKEWGLSPNSDDEKGSWHYRSVSTDT